MLQTTLTLQFPSAAAAIAALNAIEFIGKPDSATIATGAAAAPATAATPATAVSGETPAPKPAAKKTAKPADPPATASAPPAAAAETKPAATSAAPADAGKTTEPSDEYKASGISAKLAEYVGAKGSENYTAHRATAKALLKSYGVETGPGLKPEQFAPFLAELDALMTPEEEAIG